MADLKNARFGSKYGSKIRRKVFNVEDKYKHRKQVCPFCSEESVSRLEAGIFSCSSCGKKFAGGAYVPKTSANKILSKVYDKYGNLI